MVLTKKNFLGVDYDIEDRRDHSKLRAPNQICNESAKFVLCSISLTRCAPFLKNVQHMPRKKSFLLCVLFETSSLSNRRENAKSLFLEANFWSTIVTILLLFILEPESTFDHNLWQKNLHIYETDYDIQDRVLWCLATRFCYQLEVKFNTKPKKGVLTNCIWLDHIKKQVWNLP